MTIHTLHDLCYAYGVADPVREMLFALQDRITELEKKLAEVERLKGLLRMAMHVLMDLDNGLVVHEGNWHTRHHVAISKIKECLK